MTRSRASPTPRHGRRTSASSSSCGRSPSARARHRRRSPSPGCSRRSPGSSRFRAHELHRIEENIGAASVELSGADVREIEEALPAAIGDPALSPAQQRLHRPLMRSAGLARRAQKFRRSPLWCATRPTVRRAPRARDVSPRGHQATARRPGKRRRGSRCAHPGLEEVEAAAVAHPVNTRAVNAREHVCEERCDEQEIDEA